jgi:glycerol uptake facilitator-like aquaporin
MLRVVVAQLGANFVGTFILIFFATAAQIVNQKYGGAISPSALMLGTLARTTMCKTVKLKDKNDEMPRSFRR